MAVPTQPLAGYFYDELSKIRVLEPETAKTTEDMREECKEFVDSENRPLAYSLAAHYAACRHRYGL